MRFLGRALSGAFALTVFVGLLALGAWPYRGCSPPVAAAIGGACILERAADITPERRERSFVAALDRLTPETVAPVLTAFGEIRSGRSWEVTARSTGRLAAVASGFHDGARVVGGQVLVKIDAEDSAFRRADAEAAVAEARAENADAQRALALSKTQKASAEAERALRRRLLDRQLQLAERGVSADTVIDEAELALARADREVINRDQALTAAERRVAQAAARLERAKLTLADASIEVFEAEIRAPFDGLLLLDATGLNMSQATRGRLVQENEALGTLVDLAALEVWFPVSDSQFSRLLDAEGRLETGAAATVRLTLGAREISAPARLFGASASADASEGGRRVYAQLEVSGDTVFRPGDFVRVEIEEPPLAQVANVPAAALDPFDRLMVLTAAGRLSAAPVTVLRRIGDRALVRGVDGDLPWGAAYVTALTPRLAPGARVVPADPTGASAAAVAPE